MVQSNPHIKHLPDVPSVYTSDKKLMEHIIERLSQPLEVIEQEAKSNLSRTLHVSPEQIDLYATPKDALIIVLQELGVKAGDQVICPSWSSSDVDWAIQRLLLTPVLIDSEPISWNISTSAIAKALKDDERSGKIKAIIVNHNHGIPAEISSIISIAKEFQTPVIEIASEAFGSRIDNIPCGSIGDVAIIGFSPRSTLPIGNLTAVINNKCDEVILNKGQVSSQTLSTPSPIEMALLSPLLNRWPERIERLDAMHDLLVQLLNPVSGIRVLNCEEQSERQKAITMPVIMIDQSMLNFTAPQLIHMLRQEGYDTTNLSQPLHLKPSYRGRHFYSSGISEACYRNSIELPSLLAYSTSQLLELGDIIKKIVLKYNL